MHTPRFLSKASSGQDHAGLRTMPVSSIPPVPMEYARAGWILADKDEPQKPPVLTGFKSNLLVIDPDRESKEQMDKKLKYNKLERERFCNFSSCGCIISIEKLILTQRR
jgi:hypothetical protein